MSSTPKTLVLILNWNKKDFVINLLKQVDAIDFDNYDCLVVDNGSTDNSVEEIRRYFPNIEILQNDTNLGGTGGYNSGLRHVLEKNQYEYIWLLDNDTEIEPNTLSKLVNVLNSNNDIAVAGSRIIDIKDRETTTELGSFISRNTIEFFPNLTNKGIIETDYVANCSSLLRTSALNIVGLMDERYFIHWDDVDWGLNFKKNGYKVVAVADSIVYHTSATSTINRGYATGLYYGTRNGLLVYSKHINNLQRLKIFYIYLRTLTVYLLSNVFNNNSQLSKFGFSAIYDFIFNNWGKCELKSYENKLKEININDLKLKGNKILIIFDRYNNEGFTIMNNIKDKTDEKNIYALIDKDRNELQKGLFHNVVFIDFNKGKSSLMYNIKIFIKILKLNFDYSFGSSTYPYAFATKKYFVYSNNKFYNSNISMFNLYKLISASLLGEIIAIFLTPIVFISSLRYKQ